MNQSKTLRMPGPEERPVRIVQASLRVVEGDSKGASIALTNKELVIGSSPDCGFALRDSAVSRRHCKISCDAEHGYILEDLGSTNGTFVSGVRVSSAYLLPGIEIVLGSTRIIFSPESATEDSISYAANCFGAISGASAAMRKVFYLAQSYAPTLAPVLIVGETGVGKSELALEIHRHSDRCDKPFSVVDCATLSGDPSAEGILFGNELQAGSEQGIFEKSSGGTVLLDGVDELPLELQPKMMRLLENRQVRRVGSGETRDVDVRVLCSTCGNLANCVKGGKFREDLFYRLSVVTIEIPALRDRLEDLEQLIASIAARLHGASAVGELGDFAATLPQLRRYKWPGNVRELRNLVDRAFFLPTRPIDLNAAFALGSHALESQSSLDALVGFDGSAPFKEQKNRIVEEFERRYFAEVLRRNGGNISAASRDAGIERAYLHRIIRKFDLQKIN